MWFQIATLLVAVGGIYLTAWLTARRDRLSRKMQMKREVYLQVAEEFARACANIEKIGTVEWENGKERFSPDQLGPAINKLFLVGSIEVIGTACQLNSRIMDRVVSLTPNAIELMKKRIKFKTDQTSLTDNYKKISAFWESVNRGQSDAKRESAYIKGLQDYGMTLETNAKRSREEFFHFHGSFLQQCLEAANLSSAEIPPLLAIMREDVEVGLKNKQEFQKTILLNASGTLKGRDLLVKTLKEFYAGIGKGDK
jgi:hypothetical protein